MIEPGTYVRDKITGFEGVVSAYIQHLTGCDAYWVISPTLLDENKKPVERYGDEMRWEVVPNKPKVMMYERRWWLSEKLSETASDANRAANRATPPG